MKTMRKTSVSVVAALLVLFGLAYIPGFASERSGPSDDAGTIVGVVRFEGKIPKRKRIRVTSADTICHEKPIPSEDLVVSKEGKIQWTVVSIKKIDVGKTPVAKGEQEPVVIDQRGCQFKPHVVVVQKDQPLRFLNNDNILHNVHVHSKKNRPLNRSMPPSVKQFDIDFYYTETIRLACDVHQWMGGWIVVAKHPYYAVTDKDGSFQLKDVPPGTYTLQAWHESLGKQEQEITVTPGGETSTEFVFGKK